MFKNAINAVLDACGMTYPVSSSGTPLTGSSVAALPQAVQMASSQQNSQYAGGTSLSNIQPGFATTLYHGNTLQGQQTTGMATPYTGLSVGARPPFPTPTPPNIVRRDRFAELLRRIEDIGGVKGPYDDEINAMLDLRPLQKTSKVKLTAFLSFMNCNGVDRPVIPIMLALVEGWGMEFV